MSATKFHTHTEQTGKIIVPYILIFKFLDSNLEDKRFCTEWQQAFPDLNLLLISSAIEFWFVKAVPKYLNSFTLRYITYTIYITNVLHNFYIFINYWPDMFRPQLPAIYKQLASLQLCAANVSTCVR